MDYRHKIKRNRPTDATGLFWAFVCVAFGAVLLVAVPLIGSLMLASTPFFLVYQLITWRNEFRAKRGALKWCDRHCDPGLKLPIVDFMIALTLYTECSLDGVKPSTELGEIHGMFDEDLIDFQEFEWHQMWLSTVFRNARIKVRDLQSFRGKRLEDVMRLMSESAG